LVRPDLKAQAAQRYVPWLLGISPPVLPEFGELVRGKPKKYSRE